MTLLIGSEQNLRRTDVFLCQLIGALRMMGRRTSVGRVSDMITPIQIAEPQYRLREQSEEDEMRFKRLIGRTVDIIRETETLTFAEEIEETVPEEV